MAIANSLIENKLVVFNEDGTKCFSRSGLRTLANDNAIINTVNAITRLQTSGAKEIKKVSTYMLYKM